MSAGQIHPLMHHLRKLVVDQTTDTQTDRQLLRRFARAKDQEAFAALVRRHGPMVLAVCQRLLHNVQDAEDAFQAAFLTLARKANALGWQASVGNWLYVVARRLALRIKAQRARRQFVESHAPDHVSRRVASEISLREAQTILDEELSRLPDKLRAPLVLCLLEGATRDEAAHQLGCSLAMLKRRLEQGRKLLRARLDRRDLTLPALLAGTWLGECSLSAALPSRLVWNTLHAISLCAQRSWLEGFTSGILTTLPGSLLSTVLGHKLVATLALVVILATTGLGWLAGIANEQTPPDQQVIPTDPQNAQAKIDRQGDPLPPDAVMRLGTLRWRQNLSLQSVAFLADNQGLLTVGDFGKPRIWDLTTGKVQRELDRFYGQHGFSPNGKMIAIEGGGKISLFETATGKLLREIPYQAGSHILWPRGPVFSPDSQRIVARSGINAVGMWDVTTGKELFRSANHLQPVGSMGFARNSELVLTATRDERSIDWTVHRWHVATGQVLSRRSVAKGSASHGLLALGFSPDGNMLAMEGTSRAVRQQGAQRIAYTEYKVHLVDPATGQITREFGGAPENIGASAFSPDSTMLACQRIAGPLEAWDTASGNKRFTVALSPGTRDIMQRFVETALAFSPDGTLLASVGMNGVVYLVNARTGVHLNEMSETHDGRVFCVAYSPDGTLLASAGDDHTIGLWEQATGRMRAKLRGHSSPVTQLCFSPDGGTLASSAHDDTVRLWNVGTGKNIATFEEQQNQRPGHNYGVRALSFTADGKVVSAWGEDFMLRRWEVCTGKKLSAGKIKPAGLAMPQDNPNLGAYTPALDEHISSALFTRDGQTLVLGSNEWIFVVDVERAQELFRMPCPKGPNNLALSPNGRFFAAGSFYGSLILYELRTGQQLWMQETPDKVGRQKYTALAFSPDARRLVVAKGYSPTALEVLDVATGKNLTPLTGPNAFVLAMAFRPDGKQLASALGDSTILIWDATRSRPEESAARKQVSVAELPQLWEDLAAADAKKAYAAFWSLSSQPALVVPFFKQHLQPAKATDPARLRALIADLDSGQFSRREEASRELRRLGREAEAPLRQLLNGSPSPEARRRAEAIVDAPPAWKMEDPEALRRYRAVGVLERLNSAEARSLLQVMAAGAPTAPETQAAQAVLGSLGK